MVNKYLEKIASTYTSENKYIEKIASTLDWARSAAKGIGSVAKSVGKTVDTAFAGGAYKRHAQSKGITNPAVLAKIDGSPKGRKELSKAIRNSPEVKSKLKRAHPLSSAETKAKIHAHNKDVIKPHLKEIYGKGSKAEGLRDETRRAKLAVGAGAAAAAYGAHKSRQNSENSYSSYRY